MSQTTWRDNKTQVSQKVAKIRANRTATGNCGGPPIQLTNRDEKILGIMGLDYIEGVECPDTFPEEQSNSLEQLADGNETVLHVDSGNLTLRDSPQTSAIDNVNILEDFNGIDPLEESSMVILESQHEEEISEAGPSVAPRLNPNRKARRVRKESRERLSVQVGNARNDFAILGERQITCMEMFAKSMSKMAENEKERNEILKTLVESQSTVIEKLTATIQDWVEHLKK